MRPEKAHPCGREAGAEGFADERVTEAGAVDAEDPTFAEAIELLDDRNCVDPERGHQLLWFERLLENRGGQEDAVRLRALGAALGEQRFRERGRERSLDAVRHRLSDEPGIAAR